MPTYSYECQKCGRIEDLFHSIVANPRVKCKKCGASCKRKLGTGAGIIFKGSGFYETDYKRAGSKTGSEAKAEAASKSEGGEAKGGETKSEAKAESKVGESKGDSKGSESKSEKAESKSSGESKEKGGEKADSGRKTASKSAKKSGKGR